MRAYIHDGQEPMSSTQRPDTLVRDRITPTSPISLATHRRSIHLGQISPWDFRLLPENTGHRSLFVLVGDTLGGGGGWWAGRATHHEQPRVRGWLVELTLLAPALSRGRVREVGSNKRRSRL